MCAILKGEKLEKELERLESMRYYEHQYESLPFVAGIDEAGRGPLAGPVVAGCCILPKDANILFLNDSKKLSEKKRESIYLEIKDKAIAYSYGVVDEKRIDEINILNATYEAMKKAIEGVSDIIGADPDILLNDAVTIPGIDIEQRAIIKGDAKSLSIAAASVIAKVTRDHMMIEYDMEYPEYGFSKHKGYGTKMHREALIKYGPCPIHRRSFIKKYI